MVSGSSYSLLEEDGGNLEGASKAVVDWTAQIERVISFIRGGKGLSRSHKTFPAILQWVTNFPAPLGDAKRRQLIDTICKGYHLTEAELYYEIEGRVQPQVAEPLDEEAQLEAKLPKGGWFQDYVNYTRRTESPLSYHIFCSLCVLGSALGRRVYKSKGHFDIYPNYWCVLVGPPGRVKKTSAIDIARKLVAQGALCPIMSDKLTPEALVKALQTAGGHQFVYAPEFSVLLGRQRYLEGLSTLMLRLADCPSEWTVETMMRGPETVTNIALTVLGGSTMSLLTGATPDQVTSSGFLSRFVVVVEQDTRRMYPEPEKGASSLEANLLKTLERLKAWSGSATWASEHVREMHHEWYRAHKAELRSLDSEMMAEALDRMDVHLERTAMLVHLAEHDDLAVCESCFQTAVSLITYVKSKMPGAINAMSHNVRSADADFIQTVLARLGGATDHSNLLRRCSSRMDASLFKRAMSTLVEAGIVTNEKRGALQWYRLEVRDEDRSNGIQE